MTHEDPHSRAADAVHEGRPVEAQYVKQGRGGRRIMLVLFGGIALVAVAFGLLWLSTSGRIADTNANDGDQAVDAAAFQGAENRIAVPAADAPTTPEGEPTNPPTGEAPNVNAPVVQADPQS